MIFHRENRGKKKNPTSCRLKEVPATCGAWPGRREKDRGRNEDQTEKEKKSPKKEKEETVHTTPRPKKKKRRHGHKQLKPGHLRSSS